MESPIREPFFYCPTLTEGNDVVLAGDDAHHLTVQRLRPGDRVTLFDGAGALARAVIRKVGGGQVELRVEDRGRAPPLAPHLNLYSAIPKGDRMSVLLEMATQLGMTRFTPIRWRRSVTEPGPRSSERWRRICVEACKQCRRPHVPEIADLATLDESLVSIAASGELLIVAHPNDDSIPLARANLADARSLALMIGPEGGLSDEELELLRARNARFVGLGERILRIETAAVFLLCAANIAAASN